MKTWEQRCYSEGIPDEIPIEIHDKAPSYKRIAMCILNNDMHLSGLGFDRPKTIYYDVLKRMELEEKGKIQKQYKLW